MSLSKGASKEQVETTIAAAEVKVNEKPKRGGCIGFVKKWWWALLIVIAVVLLVVLLPM
jgi:hypothetical protein